MTRHWFDWANCPLQSLHSPCPHTWERVSLYKLNIIMVKLEETGPVSVFIGLLVSSGPPCSCLLLVLKEQLPELQAALLASILDMDEYQHGRVSTSGLTSPLDWTDGLLLLHSCPPPLDLHLLKLLGQPSVRPLTCAHYSCILSLVSFFPYIL